MTRYLLGLPFTLLLFVMCYSLYKGLVQEYDDLQQQKQQKERASYQKVLSELIAKRQKKNKVE